MVRHCVQAQYSTHVWHIQVSRQVVGRTVAGSATKHSLVVIRHTHGSLPDGTPIALRRSKQERPVENLPLTSRAQRIGRGGIHSALHSGDPLLLVGEGLEVGATPQITSHPMAGRATAISPHLPASLKNTPAPQLARGVAPPAPHAARRGQRAGVVRTGRDGAHPAQPKHRHRHAAVGCRPVPQLARGVVTPAPPLVSRGQRAGVRPTGRDGAPPSARAPPPARCCRSSSRPPVVRSSRHPSTTPRQPWSTRRCAPHRPRWRCRIEPLTGSLRTLDRLRAGKHDGSPSQARAGRWRPASSATWLGRLYSE